MGREETSESLKNSKVEEIVDAIDTLSKKWSIHIVQSLERVDLSFKQIRDEVDGVSNKILSERLTQLREEDIIEKNEDGYKLTEKGQDLKPVFQEIVEWRREHDG